jgi:hypothetical protein
VTSLRAKPAVALALLAVPVVLAACGGGGSSNGDPSSANYDPAHTTLKDAGFEVCGDANTQIPQNLGSGPGVQNSRAFFIAVDCKGKETSPDVAMVFQFDSKQAVDAGAKTIANALPNGSSSAYGPLVLITTGPNHQENLAAIEQALQKTYPITTTTS